MNLRPAVVALALLAFSGHAALARSNPDFSGVWNMASALEWGAEQLRIAQNDSTITIDTTKGVAVELGSKAFRLDGAESQFRAADGSLQLTAKLEWIGEALTVTTTRIGAAGPLYKDLATYSLDKEGRLVVVLILTPTTKGSMTTITALYTKGAR